jgi:isoleucyl-tRNA synthetase
VPDVFDCWFESGSMPYAQIHYPFENKEAFEASGFPAQFIAEGLDQTRGWFYSMIVLGTALFGKSPFENVIVNGLVLAEDGKKMSKSLKNYPDPIELVNETGADAIRFYLMSSSIMRAEDLNFSAKEVLELQRKNIGRLHNVLAMYEMFADGTKAAADSTDVLDRWIISRLNQLITEATAGYKNYELDKAARPVTDFIDDLSVWYLRRSRDRFKGEDAAEKLAAVSTLRFVLKHLALVIAPAMPFYAESLWQAIKDETDQESVHLAAWPEAMTLDPVVLGEMSIVREFVTLALEARTKANIKVRQPLQSLQINIEMEPEYKAIIADEINVKEIIFADDQTERVKLDTNLNEALISEGAVRELMRAIQAKRKTENLEPQDVIELTIETNELGKEALDMEANYNLLVKTVGAKAINFAETLGEAVSAGDYNFVFSIKKI